MAAGLLQIGSNMWQTAPSTAAWWPTHTVQQAIWDRILVIFLKATARAARLLGRI